MQRGGTHLHGTIACCDLGKSAARLRREAQVFMWLVRLAYFSARTDLRTLQIRRSGSYDDASIAVHLSRPEARELKSDRNLT